MCHALNMRVCVWGGGGGIIRRGEGVWVISQLWLWHCRGSWTGAWSDWSSRRGVSKPFERGLGVLLGGGHGYGGANCAAIKLDSRIEVCSSRWVGVGGGRGVARGHRDGYAEFASKDELIGRLQQRLPTPRDKSLSRVRQTH